MKKYNIVYLTTYIDKNLEKKILLPYTSAGLNKKNEMLELLKDYNVNIIFVSIFTRLSKVFIRSFKKQVNDSILHIPFFTKLPLMNYLINPLFITYELFKLNKKKKIECIILYNSVYENVIPSYIFKLFNKNVKIIIQYEDGWSISTSGIKGLIYKFSHKVGEYISSAAIINSTTFKEIFHVDNYFVFRGNISSISEYTYNCFLEERKNILFSSSIDSIRGVELLINLFNTTQDKYIMNKFIFHITGKGEDNICKKLEESIVKYCNNGGQAIYYGYVSKEKLNELYLKADILLALQKPDLEFSKYCFPSKIFEYYKYNKPIITTNISDLSSDTFFNLIFIKYSESSLRKKLSIINEKYNYYYSLNIDNSSKLFELYSLENNKKEFKNFIRKVIEKN